MFYLKTSNTEALISNTNIDSHQQIIFDKEF